MKASRLVTRPATRLATRGARTGWKMIAATVLGALFGWWWDRPGLVRDKVIESPFERRAQWSSAIFWPLFALWLAAGAPNHPPILASLAMGLGANALPTAAWVVLVTAFAAVVVMRRALATAGFGWPLATLGLASRRWLKHYRSLGVVLVATTVALPVWWLTGARGETPVGHTIPVVAFLSVGLVIALRERAWRRRVETLRPRLAAVHKVPETTLLEGAVFMPTKGKGLVMTVVPPPVVTNLEGLDGRIAAHTPQLEALINRNVDGAVTSITYLPTSVDVASQRELLASTGGLVSSLTSVHDPAPGRPDEHIARLASDVTGTRGGLVDAALAPLGYRVVDFRPDEHVAVVARLDSETVSLRDALARELGVRDLWDLEIAVATINGSANTVTVHRSPGFGSAEKRVEAWTAVSRLLLPAEPGERWRVQDEPNARRVNLIREIDPLRDTQPYPWATTTPSLARVPFGVGEDGKPLSLGLLEVNQLFGGTPGAGKSGGLTALLCGIAQLEHVALIGLDPKRVEQKPWETRFSRIARTEDDATDVLERLVVEMDRRYEWLENAGKKKFTPDLLSSERPLLVLMIDELADLVSVAVEKEEKANEVARSTMIRRLIAKGRASGIVVIAATQKPQSDVVPTALRDMIQLRVCFATTNAAMTDTVLGAGMAQNGGLAHELSASQSGVCFVVTESSRIPVRARAYWVPDEEVEEIGTRYAHLRVDLPWIGVSTQVPVAVPVAVAETEIIDLPDLSLELVLDDFEPEPVPSPSAPSSLWD